MTFEKTPAGTRGKSMPGVNSPVSRWVNNLMVRLARGRSNGRFIGMDTLVLTTTGAKTGQRRETQRITAAGPRYAGYATKTDREIPIIRLTTAA